YLSGKWRRYRRFMGSFLIPNLIEVCLFPRKMLTERSQDASNRSLDAHNSVSAGFGTGNGGT
ncbi:MAG: hypothetical protein KDD96_16660, partial [Rhodobacteraceae bacterium]|nr:hypothetical protein [Paracoccaceae bacterium]